MTHSISTTIIPSLLLSATKFSPQQGRRTPKAPNTSVASYNNFSAPIDALLDVMHLFYSLLFYVTRRLVPTPQLLLSFREPLRRVLPSLALFVQLLKLVCYLVVPLLTIESYFSTQITVTIVIFNFNTQRLRFLITGRLYTFALACNYPIFIANTVEFSEHKS